jgi:tRNA modification GTPase
MTPPGTAAVATVEVRGPAVWDAARQLFRPLAAPMPDSPVLYRFWYGRLGDGGDEVVLAVKQTDPETVVEIHCHGGRRVVRWVVEQFAARMFVEEQPRDNHPWTWLERARTVRTAGILLDQCHSVFDRAVIDVLAAFDRDDYPSAIQKLEALAAVGPVGRHLVEPWTIVVAGAPNVGKSSIVNALAGYQRSVVSDTAGTTRDVVTTAVAFDGWPVELADTAGLRRAAESLEAAGVELARRFLERADAVVWVLDATSPEPVWPGPDVRQPDLLVVNKSDLAVPLFCPRDADVLRVSALTGTGVAELVAAIVRIIVPTAPAPGAPVPYTPALADTIDSALTAARAGNPADARRLLASCATPPA